MCEIISINLAVEDQLSETVLRKILEQSSRKYFVGACFGKIGKSYLEKRINDFNNAAKGTSFIVLTDLDRIECAPILVKKWLREEKHSNLIFRVAVKEVESWVIADRISFAKFLGITSRLIPSNPDELDDPKQVLINLANRSRKRYLREALVPQMGSTAKIGPDYNSKLGEFVQSYWNLHNAINYSPSLRRIYETVDSFSPKYILNE
ncbi:MAG: hypothetical protein ABIL68_06185 [bacterium]